MYAPDDVLQALRCGVCQKYLSFFPIYIQNCTTTQRQICGRCARFIPDPTNKMIRNTSYEILAARTKFPCINLDCPELLQPQDVEKHENKCPYRTINCSIISSSCNWEGSIQKLEDHVYKSHPAHVLQNNKFELDLSNSKTRVDLLLHEHEVFMISRRYIENILKLDVRCVGVVDDSQTYNCEILAENGVYTFGTAVENSPGKVSQNVLTLSLDCNKENSVEINVPHLIEKMNNPALIVFTVLIKMLQESQDETELEGAVCLKPKETEEKDFTVEAQMMEQLECPVCFNYLCSPIYQCVQGHSICANCKDKVLNCPTCKANIETTRNFVLESLAAFFNYPCKYQEYGCRVSGKHSFIEEHKTLCRFCPHDCPVMSCTWNGQSRDILKHVMKEHHDNYLDVDMVTVYLPSDYFGKPDEDFFIMKYSNQLFRLDYKYIATEESFSWCLCPVGTIQEGEFSFEIDIVDSTNGGKRVFAKFLVDREGSTVFFKRCQIDKLFSDVLVYRVRIFKT